MKKCICIVFVNPPLCISICKNIICIPFMQNTLCVFLCKSIPLVFPFVKVFLCIILCRTFPLYSKPPPHQSQNRNSKGFREFVTVPSSKNPKSKMKNLNTIKSRDIDLENKNQNYLSIGFTQNTLFGYSPIGGPNLGIKPTETESSGCIILHYTPMAHVDQSNRPSRSISGSASRRACSLTCVAYRASWIRCNETLTAILRGSGNVSKAVWTHETSQ